MIIEGDRYHRNNPDKNYSTWKTIEAEIEKDIAPTKEDDPQTAEYIEELIRDYKLSQYKFLNLINEILVPQKILYPGSGMDVVPKLVFGEENIMHTSLEDYRNGDRKYFPELGSGMKIVADNAHMPFESSSFELILVFCLTDEMILASKTELLRVLKTEGIIATGKCCLDINYNPEICFSDLKKITVPDTFQKGGPAEVDFLCFKKTDK